MSALFYKTTLKLFNLYLRSITFLKKNRRLLLSDQATNKVNLGAGLKVYRGWINIDYNLPSLFSNYPVWFLAFLYKVIKKNNYSELDRPYRFSISCQMFVRLLKEHVFIAHNLTYGIPFNSSTVSYYYSSHMFGFSFSKEDSMVMFKEMFRTLKKGGKIRLSIDGPAYPGYEKSKKRNANAFTGPELIQYLEGAGFTNVKNFKYRNGDVPDLLYLDDYSPEIDSLIGVETIYVEAEK